MPCKIMKNCGVASNKFKTKLACILEADESTRLRMGESLPTHHEDHIAGKRKQFITALQFGSQLCPMLLAMKAPAAKEAENKKMENWRNFRRRT